MNGVPAIRYIGGRNAHWEVKVGRKVLNRYFNLDAALDHFTDEVRRTQPEPEPPQRLIQVVFGRKKGPSDPYTYALPAGMSVEIGQEIFVPVPFGSEDRPAIVVALSSDYEGWAEEIWDPASSI